MVTPSRAVAAAALPRAAMRVAEAVAAAPAPAIATAAWMLTEPAVTLNVIAEVDTPAVVARAVRMLVALAEPAA
jgi:hypothetical protein